MSTACCRHPTWNGSRASCGQASRSFPSPRKRGGEKETSQRKRLASRGVIGLLAVEHALQRVEMPLRRRRTLVQAVASDVAHGLFDHRGGEFFQRLAGPHRIDLNLGGALDV